MCFFYATVFSFNCPNIISSDVDHKSEASKFFDKWWHSYLFVNTTLKWNDHKIWLKFQFLICFYYSRVTCVLNNFDQSHTAAFISQASDIVLLVFINAGSIKSTHCILLYKSRHCPHSCLIAVYCWSLSLFPSYEYQEYCCTHRMELGHLRPFLSGMMVTFCLQSNSLPSLSDLDFFYRKQL